jgi:hypothetical protein
VIRSFFGERGAGVWSISVSRSGFGASLLIRDITLTVAGLPESPELPSPKRRIGADSTAALPPLKNASLSVPSNVTCAKSFSVKASLPIAFDLFVRDADRHSLFHVGTIQNQSSIQIPCLLKSKDVFLYAESRSQNVSLESPIHVNNPDSEGIRNPTAYSSLFVHDGAVSFPIDFSWHGEFLSTDSAGQYAIVGFYDRYHSKSYGNASGFHPETIGGAAFCTRHGTLSHHGRSKIK